MVEEEVEKEEEEEVGGGSYHIQSTARDQLAPKIGQLEAKSVRALFFDTRGAEKLGTHF